MFKCTKFICFTIFNFKIGSNAACDKPMCCSENNDHNSTKNGASFKPAGMWGDYNCDLPVWTYEALLEDIKTNHPDIDYIFLTGDFPAHDSWRQNRTGNINSTKVVVEKIKGTYTINIT